jgi:hypothetical protein
MTGAAIYIPTILLQTIAFAKSVIFQWPFEIAFKFREFSLETCRSGLYDQM